MRLGQCASANAPRPMRLGGTRACRLGNDPASPAPFHRRDVGPAGATPPDDTTCCGCPPDLGLATPRTRASGSPPRPPGRYSAARPTAPRVPGFRERRRPSVPTPGRHPSRHSGRRSHPAPQRRCPSWKPSSPPPNPATTSACSTKCAPSSRAPGALGRCRPAAPPRPASPSRVAASTPGDCGKSDGGPCDGETGRRRIAGRHAPTARALARRRRPSISERPPTPEVDGQARGGQTRTRTRRRTWRRTWRKRSPPSARPRRSPTQPAPAPRGTGPRSWATHTWCRAPRPPPSPGPRRPSSSACTSPPRGTGAASPRRSWTRRSRPRAPAAPARSGSASGRARTAADGRRRAKALGIGRPLRT